MDVEESEINKPNKKYDHVFAIIRADNFRRSEDVTIQNLVIVKKIVWTQQEAEQEVARLNLLNGTKGCLYFWQITRLEKSPASLEDRPPK